MDTKERFLLLTAKARETLPTVKDSAAQVAKQLDSAMADVIQAVEAGLSELQRVEEQLPRKAAELANAKAEAERTLAALSREITDARARAATAEQNANEVEQRLRAARREYESIVKLAKNLLQ